MNQDTIGGRSRQPGCDATTRRGRGSDSERTSLRGRVEQFFGRLRQRYGLLRDRAFVTTDDAASEKSATARSLDADRFGDQSMDSDYGSSPRVGMDNLSATPVADPQPGYVELIEVAFGRFGRGVGDQFKQHPAVALIAAASVGFVAARWATPRRDL